MFKQTARCLFLKGRTGPRSSTYSFDVLFFLRSILLTLKFRYGSFQKERKNRNAYKVNISRILSD
jgi:hypothetical protein